YRGRLTAAVRPQVPGHLARWDGERNMIDHRAIAVLLGQAAHVEHRCSSDELDTGRRDLFQTGNVSAGIWSDVPWRGPGWIAWRRNICGTSLLRPRRRLRREPGRRGSPPEDGGRRRMNRSIHRLWGRDRRHRRVWAR